MGAKHTMKCGLMLEIEILTGNKKPRKATLSGVLSANNEICCFESWCPEEDSKP